MVDSILFFGFSRLFFRTLATERAFSVIFPLFFSFSSCLAPPHLKDSFSLQFSLFRFLFFSLLVVSFLKIFSLFD